jgi:hypothetical protein
MSHNEPSGIKVGGGGDRPVISKRQRVLLFQLLQERTVLALEVLRPTIAAIKGEEPRTDSRQVAQGLKIESEELCAFGELALNWAGGLNRRPLRCGRPFEGGGLGRMIASFNTTPDPLDRAQGAER